MKRPFHERVAIRTVRAVRPALKLWWRVRRPTVVGVCAMVWNGEGKVLLVRHTYVKGWHFPGGGTAKRETLEDAVRRELMEEVGVRPLSPPVMTGAYLNAADPRSSYVVCFEVRDFQMTPKRNLEIAEWGFFAPDPDLPELGPGPRHRFQERAGLRAPDGTW